MENDQTIKTTIPPRMLGLPRLQVRRCALVVTGGPDTEAVLDPLGERTLIGRDPWCDLVLSDPRVSGQHCEIILGDDEIRIRDLESTNGTFCGDARVIEAYLDLNMILRVGDTELRLRGRDGRRVLERSPFDPTGQLIGTAPAMQRVFDMMARVAPLNLAVVLLGETGTGKTAIARALHEMSPRADRPFVSINCGALPPDLVESTLFGHVRGAFTGAHRSATGIFEQADGGTVLLDEIGEMPLNLQPKLLQVLESKRIRPVGAQQEVDVDVRLIAATHRPLAEDVANGRFRQDLYYRIAGLELVLPPLRERLEDLPLLAQAFLTRHAEAAGRGPSNPPFLHGIGDVAQRRLQDHPWPGNVRELDNVISRAVALANGPLLGPDDILLTSWIADNSITPAASTAASATSVILGPTVEPAGPDALDRSFKEFKAAVLAEHESAYFVRLLERAEGNLSRAARIAEISRTYLMTMLRKYDLYRTSGGGDD